MNTRLGKSFGLAFVVAVGILAVMFAMGTFNAQKVGAQEVVDEASISIDSPTPAAGANVEVELTFNSGTVGVPDFADLEIELDGYGLPDEIDPRDVYIRTLAAGTDPDNGSPLNVDVDGGVIILQLLDDAEERTVNIPADEDGVIITIRKRAGLTAPALAGSYDVRVGDVTLENAVTVSASLTTDPDEGGSGTEVTVTGKAFADGTGTLYTRDIDVGDPDLNRDGNIDTLVDDTPSNTNDFDYSIDVVGDGVADNNIVADGDEWKVADTAAGTNLLDPQPYTVNGLATSGSETAPTLPATDNTVVMDVTVDDGAFETTVDAADLEKATEDGRGVITFADSDGEEVFLIFTVTGTTTLGSDSVGKGKLLEIAISDWITTDPESVRIDGVELDIVGEDGTPYSVDAEDGDDTFYVKITGAVGLGSKTVVLFDDADVRLDSATVEITAIGLEASPSTAVVGQEVTITGSGFDETEGNVRSIMVGDAPVCDGITDCDIEVASGGRVVAAFDVPNDAALAGDGDYTIVLTDTDGRIGTATLTIPEPTLTVDPAEGRIGTTVNVSGAGWPTGTGANLVAIYYGDNQYTTAISSSDGTWWTSLTVPTTADVGRTNTIKATATVGGGTTTNVEQVADHKTPDPVVSLSSGQAQRGTTVTVSGDNFHVFETVRIEIGDSTVTPSPAPTTDGTGSFSADVLVPGLGLGNKNLKVTVRTVPVVEFLEIVATPVSTSMASADAFASLITAGNLTVVWNFDNATKAWSFYDPRPAVAGAVDLNEVSSGNNVWIRVTADQMFQGDMLTAGWNLVTLD